MVAFLALEGEEIVEDSSSDEEARARPPRAPALSRIYRKRVEPLSEEEFSDRHILQKYRISREKIYELAAIYEHSGYCITKNAEFGLKGSASTPIQQMCFALRYFGHGGVAIDTADALHFSKATALRSIDAVTEWLLTLTLQYIQFPTDQESINKRGLDFTRMARDRNLRVVHGVQLMAH